MSGPAVATSTEASRLLEAESLYNQGIRLEDQGQYDQAAEAFNQAINAVNNYFPAWLHRGRVELLRNQPAAAMMFLEAAAGLKPSDSQALHWRGDAYLRTGDLHKAIQDYSQGIPIEQDNFERAEMYTSRGEAYLQLKRNDEALSDYSAAIRWNAVSAEPYYQRGVLLETIGKFREASADFAVALAMNPSLEKAKQARMRVTALITQQASAAPPTVPAAVPAPQPTVASAPVQPQPASAPAPLPYLITPSSQAPATSTSAESKPTQAAPVQTAPAPAPAVPAPQHRVYTPAPPIKTMVSENKPQAFPAASPAPKAASAPAALSASAIRDAQLRWKEGVDLVNQHRELDAIPLFDESLRLNPNNPQAYNGRGFARLLLKEYVPAIRDFDEAIRLNPQYTNAQWNRNVAIRESSRAGSMAQNVTPKKAEPQKADSQPVVKASQPVVKAFDLWQNGRKLIAEGKYQNAVEQFDEAIRRDSRFAQAYNARGFAFLLLRQYQRALADFEVALKIEPQYENAAHNRRVALQAASVAARREGM